MAQAGQGKRHGTERGRGHIFDQVINKHLTALRDFSVEGDVAGIKEIGQHVHRLAEIIAAFIEDAQTVRLALANALDKKRHFLCDGEGRAVVADGFAEQIVHLAGDGINGKLRVKAAYLAAFA